MFELRDARTSCEPRTP